MSQTQSIIVYRNPLEQAIWEGAFGAQLSCIIFGIVAFFVVFLLLNKITTSVVGNFGKKAQIATNVNLVLGAVAGVATIYFTWL